MSMKFIFGMMVDTVRFGKSRRKAFLIITTLTQLISLQVLYWIKWDKDNKWVIASLGFIIYATIALGDTVVDAISVEEASKEPIKGATNLRSLASFANTGCQPIAYLIAG